jgi:hypothetical protein
MKTLSYSTPLVENVERACVLVVIPGLTGNITYRCVRWQNVGPHWVIETPDGDQVEIHGGPAILIHIPRAGYTFELDGTPREVRHLEPVVVLQ